MNHFPDRLAVPAASGIVSCVPAAAGAVHRSRGRHRLPSTNDELARRSSIGLFLFVPPGVNDRLIVQAGFRLVQQEDVTANAALVAGRWHRARQAHREDLVPLEGEERFAGLQRFFATVHNLTSQRRLSRIAYLVEKPGA